MSPAGQAAIALADNASPVTMVIRAADLAADMSQYLIERIMDEPDIVFVCDAIQLVVSTVIGLPSRIP